jgi:hypothetical protein
LSSTKYTYSITNDFPNQKVNAGKLSVEIYDNDIITALDYIEVGDIECNIWFKAELNISDSTTLDYIISVHDGEPLPEEDINPRMEDGRLIVRADSRPLECQTYFTMIGDDATAGIGCGVECAWDFSNNDNIVTGDHVPPGMKCKELILTFLCPVYTKDGCIYFSNMPWGSYVTFDIVVPPKTYYPNPAGTIPASALGLSGTDMYAYSGNEYISYAVFLMKHRLYGSCSMGDELNAEGSSTKPIPVGWGLRCRIYTLEDDNIGKGYGEFELHRKRTVLLPGESL